MSIQDTGIIAGRLVNTQDRALTDAIVTIFSADGVTEETLDKVHHGFTPRSSTDQQGRFSFVRLPPGRYILAVNLVMSERIVGSKAANYPRMFYPGVTSFQEARAVTLAPGKELKDIEFKLHAEPKQHTRIGVQ